MPVYDRSKDPRMVPQVSTSGNLAGLTAAFTKQASEAKGWHVYRKTFFSILWVSNERDGYGVCLLLFI